MSYQTHYGGIIWTNHAQERLASRAVPQQMALSAFQSPDASFPGKNPGTMQFEKKVQSATITLIAKRNEKREWIILSGWIDPPIFGTKDYKKREDWKKYKKAGFWGKVWYQVKQQFGM